MNDLIILLTSVIAIYLLTRPEKGQVKEETPIAE